MFGNKRVRELEDTVGELAARLAEAEARITGLVELAGANEQLDQRFAHAIDEIERRQANGLHVVNAAFTGLSKRVEVLAAGQSEAASDKPSQVSQSEAVPAASPSDPHPIAAGPRLVLTEYEEAQLQRRQAVAHQGASATEPVE